MAAASGVAHDQRQRRTEKCPNSCTRRPPDAAKKPGARRDARRCRRRERLRLARLASQVRVRRSELQGLSSGRRECPGVASLRAAGGAESRRVRATFVPEGPAATVSGARAVLFSPQAASTAGHQIPAPACITFLAACRAAAARFGNAVQRRRHQAPGCSGDSKSVVAVSSSPSGAARNPQYK